MKVESRNIGQKEKTKRYCVIVYSGDMMYTEYGSIPLSEVCPFRGSRPKRDLSPFPSALSVAP